MLEDFSGIFQRFYPVKKIKECAQDLKDSHPHLYLYIKITLHEGLQNVKYSSKFIQLHVLIIRGWVNLQYRINDHQ